MTYIIKDFSDEFKTINVEVNGKIVIVDYPKDILSYSQFNEESKDIYISGIVISHTDIPVVEQETQIANVTLSGFLE